MDLNRRSLVSMVAAAAVIPLRFLKAAAGTVRGAVTGVVNSVSSTRKDEPEGTPPVAVAQGDQVDDGMILQTGRESAVEIALVDGSMAVIGQRSSGKVGGGAEAMELTQGNFRFKTGQGDGVNRQLATPALQVTLKGTDIVVSVDENRTICGVVEGAITCTSKKTGASVEVPQGKSVVWAKGSFGDGIAEGVFVTGDIAVDQGIEAARAAWTPVAPTPTPEPPPIPTPPRDPRPKPRPNPRTPGKTPN